MSDLQSRVFQVGDFRVDPMADEISRGGAMVKLEPRCMALLIYLSEHAGQVLSVEDILDHVWKDVVVNPDSVYQAVATLRRLLEDDAKSPKYIANVVRRGYRLIAQVTATSAVPSTQPPAPDLPRPVVPGLQPPVTKSRLGFVLALMSFAAVGVAAALWIWYRAHASDAAAGAAASVTENSVAVLPFLDLSERKDEGFFADGISDELINVLSRQPEIRVPARTSSFYFKDRPQKVAEIAHSLNVRYLLEGSVRKSGDTLRVSAQLIRADSGFNIWSQTYDRPLTDVFKLQDEIAAAVVSSLATSILTHELSAPPASVNPAAYTLYLKARMLAQGGASDDYDSAEKAVQQALTIDPGFPLGWALLADINTNDLDWHAGVDHETHCERAERAVAEAVRLNPNVSEVHRALGSIDEYCRHDVASAEAEFKSAIAGGDVSAMRALAGLYLHVDRKQKALDAATQGAIRDPLNAWSHVSLMFSQAALGKLDEA